MAMTQREKAALDAHITREQPWDEDNNGPRKLFDITCVVASVYDDPASPLSPYQAAFVAIANQDAPGVFTFPTESGHEYTVTVERKDPPRDMEAQTY